jgi:3-methyladenine DNA glycosylase AlkD
MKEEDRLFIEEFLDKADPKIAKSQKRFFNQGDDSFSKNDIMLGISMPTIKQYIKNSPKFGLETIVNLTMSEYNEARTLGWALLVRDIPDPYILSAFIQKMAPSCGNWNVVDFAAPICAKTILKIENPAFITSIAYALLESEEFNIWSHRFCILMSIPVIQAGYCSYGIDIVDRSLETDDDLILKPCAWVLMEIKKQNENIFNLFMKNNSHLVPKSVKQYIQNN